MPYINCRVMEAVLSDHQRGDLRTAPTAVPPPAPMAAAISK
jgi:hypothetical protein